MGRVTENGPTDNSDLALKGGGSNNTQHKGQIYIGCPSRGYVSKTKQDRHKVTMEHCIEVCITDSVAALKFS